MDDEVDPLPFLSSSSKGHPTEKDKPIAPATPQIPTCALPCLDFAVQSERDDIHMSGMDSPPELYLLDQSSSETQNPIFQQCPARSSPQRRNLNNAVGPHGWNGQCRSYADNGVESAPHVDC